MSRVPRQPQGAPVPPSQGLKHKLSVCFIPPAKKPCVTPTPTPVWIAPLPKSGLPQITKIAKELLIHILHLAASSGNDEALPFESIKKQRREYLRMTLVCSLWRGVATDGLFKQVILQGRTTAARQLQWKKLVDSVTSRKAAGDEIVTDGISLKWRGNMSAAECNVLELLEEYLPYPRSLSIDLTDLVSKSPITLPNFKSENYDRVESVEIQFGECAKFVDIRAGTTLPKMKVKSLSLTITDDSDALPELCGAMLSSGCLEHLHLNVRNGKHQLGPLLAAYLPLATGLKTVTFAGAVLAPVVAVLVHASELQSVKAQEGKQVEMLKAMFGEMGGMDLAKIVELK
ncbi:hypothetical protein RQP46_008061 [Phenoliferia psychrophenolica]